MKKIVRLTESDLVKLVKRVIAEQTDGCPYDIKTIGGKPMLGFNDAVSMGIIDQNGQLTSTGSQAFASSGNVAPNGGLDTKFTLLYKRSSASTSDLFNKINQCGLFTTSHKEGSNPIYLYIYNSDMTI